MGELLENAAKLRRAVSSRGLLDLDLGRSFRTAQNVLSFVDRAIGALGWQALGLEREPGEHLGDERPGLVRYGTRSEGSMAMKRRLARKTG